MAASLDNKAIDSFVKESSKLSLDTLVRCLIAMGHGREEIQLALRRYIDSLP
jgi:hypothetical protein